MKLSKAIAKRVQELREATGLSQQEIAQRGDLSVSLVAKLEQGKKADPRASTLLALARAFEVKPGRLLDDLFPPAPAKAEAPEAEAGKEHEVAEEPSLDGSEADSTLKKDKKKKGKKKHKELAKHK